MYIDIIGQKKKPIHPDINVEDDEPVIMESEHDPKKQEMELVMCYYLWSDVLCVTIYSFVLSCFHMLYI